MLVLDAAFVPTSFCVVICVVTPNPYGSLRVSESVARNWRVMLTSIQAGKNIVFQSHSDFLGVASSRKEGRIRNYGDANGKLLQSRRPFTGGGGALLEDLRGLFSLHHLIEVLILSIPGARSLFTKSL